MSSYFKLGLFILGGTVVLAVMLIAVGAGALFRPKIVLETYIDGTVQGLDVGSAVKYRGVSIGRVSEITFTYTEYEQDKPPLARRTYVMVLASVQPQLIGGAVPLDRQQLKAQIDRGLRVRLAAVGITGTSFLELDYVDPQANPVLPIDWEPEHLYVPSAPGLVAQITSAVEAFARRLENIDVEGLIANVNTLTTTAQQKLAALPVERLSAEATGLLAELRTTNRDMQKSIGSLQALLADPAWRSLAADAASAAKDAAAAAAQAKKIAESGELERAFEQLNGVVARADRLVARADRLLAGEEDDIATLVANLRRAADNLRVLSEELRSNPSQLLRSAPPRREPAR